MAPTPVQSAAAPAASPERAITGSRTETRVTF
jgi:hypothetical protein